MTAAATSFVGQQLSASDRQARRNGQIRVVLYGLVGLVSVAVGLFRVPADQVTTYKLVLGPEAFLQLPNVALPVGTTFVVAGLLCFLAAGLQARNLPNPAWRRQLAVVIFATVFATLTGILGGKEPSLVGLLAATVSFALPIVISGLGSILCERSGVMNIGMEGIILFGACATSIGGSLLGGPVAGVDVGVVFGLLLGLLLAVLAIRYQVDQVIAGTVLNLAAAGITTFAYTRILQAKPELNSPGLVGSFAVPVLSEIPLIGPALFTGPFFLFVAYALIVGLQFAIFRTRWGLRLRAAGEEPKAAGTIGIDVLRVRYVSVAAGAALGGLAGAFLVVSATGSFQIGMSAGIGFIGMAAMIFGGWNPIGIAGAALVFGFARSAESRLGTVGVEIPTVFLSILPYVVTIVVVAGVVGRVRGPAAAGQPYEQV